MTLLSTLPNGVNDFAIAGDYLYVARGADLNVFDISDPSNPSQVGNFHDSCSFESIDVLESEGYLTQVQLWCSPNPDNFSLFDLSDPTNPVRIGESLHIGGIGASIKVIGDGDFAYILHAYTGLVIVDVRNPNDLKIVGTYRPQDTLYYFFDMELEGDYAYITDLEGHKLWVVNVSDKTSPVGVGEPLAVPASLGGIDIEGNNIFLANGVNGLTVVDKTDIGNLKIIKTHPMSFYVRNVDVSSNFAFVANNEAGVKVLDISNLDDIKNVADYTTPDRVWKVKVDENLVFANDPVTGLYILRFSGLAAGDVDPFLDLPWDYKSKGMSFDEAALAINSYFDHEYPLLSTSLVEPPDKKFLLTDFLGNFDTNLEYSSHDGYDYGKSKAKVKNGDDLLAAASGTATYMGTCGACGNAILIDHGNGYQTRYYHLQKEGLVVNEAGKSIHVEKGQKIGKVGFSGRVVPAGELGAHIHFMVVQDKNNDGNFSDNIPDGLVDPFGWQGNDPDPWSIYSFNYNEKMRTGNKSKYLWTTPLGSKSGQINPENSSFNLGRYYLDFELWNEKTYKVEMQSAANNNANTFLRSFSSSLLVTMTDESGAEITSLEKALTLKFDLSGLNFDEIDPNSLSIYSSSDGINWTKEETLVDLTNRSAVSQIDHLSYFALMADRLDVEPPQTSIEIIGDEGEENYFRSDVAVKLFSEDNLTGVDYTFYKIDSGEWEQYVEQIEVAQEGEHKIEYYSVDKDENIEEVKNSVFYVDKTSPELRIAYDKENLDTLLQGIDGFGDTDVSVSPSLITVKDKAGNSLNIYGTFDTQSPTDKLVFSKISYGNQVPVKVPINSYTAGFKKDPSGNLISIYQNWTLFQPTPILVATDFRTKTNSTRIYIKEGNAVKLDTWLSDPHFLSIVSERGSLKYSYE